MAHNVHRLKQCHCPNCNKLIDAVTEVTGDSTPDPGDYTVCAYCLHVLVFNDDLTPVKPNKKQYEEMPVEILEAISQARIFNKLDALNKNDALHTPPPKD